MIALSDFYFFPKFQNVRVCQDMCTNFSWGRRRFSTSETLVDVIHSRVRSCLNMWDDGLLRTILPVDFYPRKLGKVLSFILRFFRFVRKFCTFALNYFIFAIYIIYHECQKSRNSRTCMYEMKGLLFQPCFPHKGQELQTTDNEL